MTQPASPCELPDKPGIWKRPRDADSGEWTIVVLSAFAGDVRLDYSGWQGARQVAGLVHETNLPTGNWFQLPAAAELAKVMVENERLKLACQAYRGFLTSELQCSAAVSSMRASPSTALAKGGDHAS